MYKSIRTRAVTPGYISDSLKYELSLCKLSTNHRQYVIFPVLIVPICFKCQMVLTKSNSRPKDFMNLAIKTRDRTHSQFHLVLITDCSGRGQCHGEGMAAPAHAGAQRSRTLPLLLCSTRAAVSHSTMYMHYSLSIHMHGVPRSLTFPASP